jgi:NADPH:quinone reductase-like Zn-dependent oxidoreductase
MFDHSHKLTKNFVDMVKGVEEGWLKPHVDKEFAFDKLPEAHDYLEARKNFGKVIVTIE